LKEKKKLVDHFGFIFTFVFTLYQGRKKSVVLCISRGKKLKNFGMKEN
jgi:hypothetical protein